MKMLKICSCEPSDPFDVSEWLSMFAVQDLGKIFTHKIEG